MGCVNSISSHFTYEERIQLEFYLFGTGKLPKITNKVKPGILLHKSPKTISREIQRGQARHFFDRGLQKKMIYNADHTENQARLKDSRKGPDLKLGRDYIFVERISTLMKEHNYSPHAVIAEFNNNGWPTEARICEKTLYNYIYEGLILGVSEKDLQMKEKGRKQVKCKRNHKNAALAQKSIAYKPKKISTREEFGH